MAVATQAHVEYVSGVRFDNPADPAIEFFLDAAQSLAERYLGCPLAEASYTEIHDGSPIIVLDRYPIRLDPGPVIHAYPVTVPPGAPLDLEPAQISDMGLISGLTGRVQVEYTAGYDPIPADLIAAVAQAASSLYVESQGSGGASAGVTSKSIGDFSVSYGDPSSGELLFGGLAGRLFGPFRRWVTR